jgi:serine/threonine-protein kinase RsbW
MVLSIPSDFKYLGAVDAAIQDLAREFAFSENSISDMSTALIEACSNAIEHGNKFSKEKRVKIVLGFNGASVTARVYDQGDGFDYEELLGRTAPPDPMSERGRGLMIMSAFTDNLDFKYANKDGLCVELTKSNEESDDDDAQDS